MQSILAHNFDTAKEYKAEARDWLSSFWAGFNSPSQLSRIRNTGVPMEFLKEVSASERWQRLYERPDRTLMKVWV